MVGNQAKHRNVAKIKGKVKLKFLNLERFWSIRDRWSPIKKSNRWVWLQHNGMWDIFVALLALALYKRSRHLRTAFRVAWNSRLPHWSNSLVHTHHFLAEYQEIFDCIVREVFLYSLTTFLPCLIRTIGRNLRRFGSVKSPFMSQQKLGNERASKF